jgi:thiamine biosynthesis protein ThiI
MGKKKLILEQYNLILIRYAEIWLKSQKVKIRMLKFLMNNIKNILKRKGIPFNKYQLSKDSSRVFFFFNNKDIPNAIEVLKNSFGVHSLSPAIRTSNSLKNITERTIELAKEILEKDDSFALRVRRSGKHDYTSMDVAKIVGKAVIDDLSNHNLKVNLTHPKKQIFIEIRQDFSYIFSQVINSQWGGLPIEPVKKILVMDVGRLNDLIAGFLLMRRGSEIYPVLFDITEDKALNDIWISNWKEVTDYIPFNQFRLRKVNLYNILKKLSSELNEIQYFCGLCRLIRFDLLSRILTVSDFSFYGKIRAITDGVSLSCSSICSDSVDLDSIALSHLISKFPIFTPLIGFGIDNIEKLASKISKNFQPIEYCPFKPEDQEFDAEKLNKIYANLNLDKIIEESVEKIVEIKIL